MCNKKLNKKKKKKSHVPVRLNILFLIVFILFSTLILRLGVVQIVYGDDYRREIERTEDVTVNKPVPRGKIFDRTGKVIVDNIPENAITYTNSGATQKEMLEVAEKLAKLIVKNPDKVTERDKKDYWIIKNTEKAEEKVPDEEREKLKEEYEGKEFDKEVYKLKLARITEQELNELSAFDLQVLAIYRDFTSGYALTPQMVKNKDVTPEEFAVVSENLQLLPGVDTTTDWERYYAFGKTLRSVLGNITSSDEGIPAEQLDYYLARDYSRNDRVGKSYIEMQYEDVLHGQKAKVKNVTQKGKVLETIPISEGKRGKDLVLGIDMDLQIAVEKIIEEELLDAKKMGGTSLLDRAFVTIMDPYTGEILTMAGKQITEDKNGNRVMEDNALGNITTTYNAGSAIKGATILTGYKTGAIKPGDVFYDTPLKIKNTNAKKSWKNLGSVNDIDALKLSSNVYMFHTAINIGEGTYQYDRPLRLQLEKGFATFRESFAQFGLGVRTGIDLPNEQIGYKGNGDKPGFLLDFSIGQFDTYSNMQLAQYVSTIANGGNRMEPHIVKEIREPLMENDELGPIVQEISPKVLNQVDGKEEWFERVQLGFKKVAQEKGGTAYYRLGGKSYNPAGKTGTAQAFYDGPKRKTGDPLIEVINLTFAGYAPADNPEIAISVLVPWAYESGKGHSKNIEIAERVFDTYFELKKQRQMNNNAENVNANQTDEIKDASTDDEIENDSSVE